MQNVDQGRMFRALLTDLSNAFGCLPPSYMQMGLIRRH